VAVAALGLAAAAPASGGGPLIVGGTFGIAGVPFTWDTSLGEFPYRTDGGKLGLMDNPTANARVAALFQVWEDVPTASIGFNNAGAILSTGVFSDGDVDTVKELDAVTASCDAGTQSPIVYDTKGTLFNSLFGENSGVIGLAGVCALSDQGRILSALVALNGDFLDGDAVGEYEVTDNEFDAVFIHEFGHLFGLGHSQVNVNCLTGSPPGCTDFSDDAFGLPTMFPFLLSGLEETPGVHPARTLSADDVAWVSKLYPEAGFSNSYGVISGTIFFGDGLTPVQGVNVIARRVDDPGTPENEGRRVVVSVVSGYLFTGVPGQNVTGNNPPSPFGSRSPLLIGTYEIAVPPGNYTVEVESVLCPYSAACFEGGSRVGPLDRPLPSPGPPEFWNLGESSTDVVTVSTPITVSAGGVQSGIHIILNVTLERLDRLESAGLGDSPVQPAWVRRRATARVTS
jgi:hypothetical protein